MRRKAGLDPVKACVAVAAFLLFVGGAQGAFPGANGEIAIDGVTLLSASSTSRTGTVGRRLASGLYPSWSADGAEIAFLRLNGAGPDFALALMQANGSDVRTIVPSGVYPQRPSWSPNGDRLLYVQRRFDSRSSRYIYEIWIVNRDGSGRQRLRDNASTPAWSPDGSTIAFSSHETARCGLGDRCIWLSDPSLTNARVLTRRPAGESRYSLDSWPAWSPDGRSLVFERYLSISSESSQRSLEDPQLRVINVDGSAERLLYLRGFSPAWSPDGTKIVFSTEPEGQSNIAVIDAQGGRPSFLYPGSNPDWRPCRPATRCGPAPPAVVPPPPPLPPGRARCVVPDVRGRTVAQAKAVLKMRRCAPGKLTYAFHRTMKKGRVIAQNKRPGTQHPRNTKIRLTVSKGRRRN